MRNPIALAVTLLCSLQQIPAVAGTIYRWSDRQGQVHFSDTAPGESETVVSIPQPAPSRLPVGKSLRAGERKTLLRIQQRSQQQTQAAQSRGLKSRRERAEQQQRCETNRQQLRDARGKETYKQYSSYLREHCW